MEAADVKKHYLSRISQPRFVAGQFTVSLSTNKMLGWLEVISLPLSASLSLLYTSNFYTDQTSRLAGEERMRMNG